MAVRAAGVGTRGFLRASTTFPIGFSITQFADDADPIDLASIQVADKAIGLNGDLIYWPKASVIAVTLNVIPNSDDDRNLAILAQANRVARGKLVANDVITLAIYYPDGRYAHLTPGVLTDAMFANSIASAARLKTKPYIFAFEEITGKL